MNDAVMWRISRRENVRLQSNGGSRCGAPTGRLPCVSRKCGRPPVFFCVFFFCVATSCFLKCVWSWAHCSTAAAEADKHRAQARLVEEGLTARSPGCPRTLHVCAARFPPPVVSARDWNQVAGGLPVCRQNHPCAAHFVRIGRRFASPLRLQVLLARDGALGSPAPRKQLGPKMLAGKADMGTSPVCRSLAALSRRRRHRRRETKASWRRSKHVASR